MDRSECWNRTHSNRSRDAIDCRARPTGCRRPANAAPTHTSPSARSAVAKSTMKSVFLFLLLLLLLVRQTNALTPGELQQIGFDQNIGQQISSDLTFHDSDGTPFR